MLTHKNLSSNALTLMDCWRFTSGDRLIHALPVFHAHGTRRSQLALMGASWSSDRSTDGSS